MISAPPRAPRLWQTMGYGLRPDPFFAAGRARAGDAFEVKVIAETWTVLGHPDGVRAVFGHGPDDLDSGVANQPLRPVIGTRNVLLLDGPEHLRRRRLVLPPLHGERMRAYAELIGDAAAAEVASWPRGASFAVLPRMQALTFSVIQGAVFGPDERERLAPLAVALSDLIGWITAVPRALVYTFLGPDAEMRLPGYRRRVAALDRLVAEQVARRRADPALAERPDVLSLLLQARDEEGRALSDADVRDEIVTLLVAGHETTASTLAWALHDLARAPAVQERVASGDTAYADAVVTETLRLHPPVPVVVRRLRRPLRFAGHDLPTGATVAPCSLLVHRRPDVYPDPFAFRPERWLGVRPAAAEWFPFGGGVRRCVGAAFATFEARVVIQEVARAIRLAPAQPGPERTGRRGIVLVPEKGGRVVAD